MNKLCIILLFLFFFYNKSYNQNLIPNAGFELQINCPNNEGYLNSLYIHNWQTPSAGSTDYFSKCVDTSGNNFVHIPANYFTYQNTNSNNYIGLIMYATGSLGINYREYAQVKLLNSLKKNKNYQLDIYLNRSNYSYYATNIQICFSKDSINSSSFHLIDTGMNSLLLSTPIILDTLNWIRSTIVFNTGDRDSLDFLTLGNFLSDEHTRLDSFNGVFLAQKLNYTLIDSISLIPWYGVNINDIEHLNEINIYPNPVIDYIYIDFDKNKKLFYTLYDISGKAIFSKKILTQTIDINGLEKGMYILEIKDEEDNSIRKKVMKE